MRKYQTFKDGVMIEEVEVPDEPIAYWPEQERIDALEAEIAEIKAALSLAPPTLSTIEDVASDAEKEETSWFGRLKNIFTNKERR